MAPVVGAVGAASTAGAERGGGTVTAVSRRSTSTRPGGSGRSVAAGDASAGMALLRKAAAGTATPTGDLSLTRAAHGRIGRDGRGRIRRR
ncbi:hypothetical protein DKL51_30145 [Micromonospora globispora]|nr:hypothetical protein DKL51_30145 [Micromonospora globispora]